MADTRTAEGSGHHGFHRRGYRRGMDHLAGAGRTDPRADLRPGGDVGRHHAPGGGRLPPLPPSDVPGPADASGRDLDWALRGVGVLPHDRRIVDALNGQDGLYTLVMKYSDGRLEPRIIGSITGMMYLHDDPRAVVEAMAVASVRIVSLTITEGGYLIDSVTGEFDVRHPSIQPDLQPGAEPETGFGIITAALALRRSRGIA